MQEQCYKGGGVNSSKIFLFLILFSFNSLYVKAQCLKRPNITTFSNAEQEELKTLIMDYLKIGFDPSQVGTEQYPIVNHHAEHAGFVHGQQPPLSERFVTWHRYYIQELEHYLLSKGKTKYIPLPSWSPQQCIPNAFWGASAILSPPATFPALQNQCPSSSNVNQWLGPNKCANFSNFGVFARSLETGYHNGVHGSIGGVMGFVAPASGSAIFWLWHAWVDDIANCYQKECLNLTHDLYIRDEEVDDGTEPSNVIQFWNSPDIWVRNNNDGFGTQVTEPINESAGKKAYVYVKVWNKGQIANPNNAGTITAYWAKASTALGWQIPWNGTTGLNGCQYKLGDIIGTQPIRSINENFLDETHTPAIVRKDFTIYEFEWAVPDPDKLDQCFPNSEGWEKQHFCILARMDDGIPKNETSNLSDNVIKNNNIAMRNITLIGDGKLFAPPPKDKFCVFVGNPTSSTITGVDFELLFNKNRELGTLLDHAQVNLSFKDGLEIKNTNVTTGLNYNFKDNNFNVTQNIVTLKGFTFLPYTVKKACIQVIATDFNNEKYDFDLVQKNSNKVVGGEKFVVNLKQAPLLPSIKSINSIQNSANVLIVYPNPSSDIINIDYPSDNNKHIVSITDPIGRVLKYEDNITGRFSISVKTLPKGIYFVNIVNEVTQAKYEGKFIVE